MANSVTTNPLILDTAGAILTTPTHIKAIRVQFSADEDDVVLSDKGGKVVFSAKGGDVSVNGYNDSITIPGGIKCDGLTVTTIDGTSKAYVYLK